MSDNEMLEKILQRWEKQPDVMLPCAVSHTCGEVAGWIRALRASAALCEDCPPAGYPTDKTRCAPCPRAAAASAEPVAWRWRIKCAKSSDDWWYDDDWKAFADEQIEREPLYTHPAPDAEIVAALEAARDAVVYSIEANGMDRGGVILQAVNKIDAALAKAKGGSRPARQVPANDCKDPSSCDRHNECMYLGCSAFKGFS